MTILRQIRNERRSLWPRIRIAWSKPKSDAGKIPSDSQNQKYDENITGIQPFSDSCPFPQVRPPSNETLTEDTTIQKSVQASRSLPPLHEAAKRGDNVIARLLLTLLGKVSCAS
jgi:hypothetical protein